MLSAKVKKKSRGEGYTVTGKDAQKGLTKKVTSQPRPEGNAYIWEGRRNSKEGSVAGAVIKGQEEEKRGQERWQEGQTM